MKKQKKKKYLLLALCLFFLLISFVFLLWLSPRITLNGKQKMTVNINASYKEMGAKATYHLENVTDEVIREGFVNTKKKGTYLITYKIKKGGFTKKAIRTVIVKDIEPPKIELVDGKKIFLCQKGKYQEPGYKARDNVDGDITKKVKIKQEEDQIIYTVKDRENNQTSVTRKLFYRDVEPPQIKLFGGNVTFTYLGEPYQELGYQVVDNCDGDITEQVKVSGDININALGQYELVYQVKDEAGNIATAKRTVNVAEKEQNGTIYLTFDDGPKEGTTNVILDILKEEGIKATFFVTNNGPDYLIQREKEEGHTVALHTASHDYATVYSSVENYFKDLEVVHDRVLRITGDDARIIRFPGGSSNTVSRRYASGIMTALTREVLLRGYRYYDWNLSSGDAGEVTTKEGVYQNVINNLSKRRVNMVLMHDIKPYTRDALREIIRYGKNNGYTFAAIEMQTEMITQRVNN